MTNRRAKIAAAATVVGLGALGGAALGSNPGMPAATQLAAHGGSAAVVTSASGATATPVAQTVAVGESAAKRAPIVTRASGAPGAPAVVDD
jgi:hypothetical protein